MEQDLDKFIKSRDLVFEFPRMQSTFQRAIAYKVAQYYSLETSARDTCIVIARKKLGSKLPAVKLVDIVATFKGESSESENSFTIKPRSNPQRSQSSEFGRMLITQIGPKSVEEREEGYKKARARIFNENSKDSSNEAKVALEEPSKKKTELSPREEIKINSSNSPDNGEVAKKVTKVESSRNKAIIRDPEKERSDPDFARNRGRLEALFFPVREISRSYFLFLFSRYVPGYDPVFRPPNPQFYYPNPYALAGHYNAEFPSLNHNQNPQVSQSNQPPIYGGDSVPQSWIHPHYSGAPYWPGASAAPYYQGHGYPHSSQAGVYLPSRGPSASLQSPNSNSVDHSQSSQVQFLLWSTLLSS